MHATTARHHSPVETLESRRLCAGDVRAGVDLGLLSVTGDEADNAILVTQRTERVRNEAGATTFRRSIVVTGLWKDGAQTTVNGARSASFPVTEVTDMVIDMAGGDDHATVTGVRLSGVLGMDGGDFGNDAITVVACRVGRLGIRMGPGDDRLYVLGTTVESEAVFNGEDGRDVLVSLLNRFGSQQVNGFETVFPRP